MRRSVFGGLLAVALLLGGCAQQIPSAQEKQGTVTLTALQYELENQAINFADMWYYEQLEEQTGVHVDFEEVKHSDWETRVSLMFASGNYRDLILRGSLDVEDYGVTQGLVLPLDEYLDTYMPHYASRLSLDGAGDSIPSSDGKSYYVGFLISQNINTDGHFFINRTWLDQLGLEVPQTIHALTQVLRAFKNDDPNGNGLADEIPYQATFDNCNTGIYNAFSAWGIPMNEYYVYLDKAGTVRFAPEQEGFLECLRWLNLLCSEGLLDVECITQGSNLWGAKVNQGTTGYFSYWRLQNSALSPEITKDFECMLPVHAQGYEAKLGRLMDTVEFGAALSVTNPDVPASLSWLDAQMETENMMVAQNGPVGDMLFVNEQGRYQVAYVPSDNELYSLVPVIGGQFFAPETYYRQVYEPAPHRKEKSGYSAYYEQAGVLEENAYRILTQVMPITSEEATRLQILKTQIKNALDDGLVGFITHEVTQEGFDAYVQTLRSAGAEEYIAIYQAAYDRYIGRVE